MALVLKLSPGMKKTMEGLDRVRHKAKSTYRELSEGARKTTERLRLQNKQMILATAGTMAMFWGMAQVSPVVSAYLEEFQGALGNIFDTIFTALSPVVEKFLDLVWRFGDWLEKSPGWVSTLIGVLIMIPPIILAINMALKVWAGLMIVTKVLNYTNLVLLKHIIHAKLLDIKVTLAQRAAILKTAVATRILNATLMASPWAMIAIAVAGIALGVGAWALSQKSLNPALSTSSELTGDLTEKQMELNQALKDAQSELDGYHGDILGIVDDVVLVEKDVIGALDSMISKSDVFTQDQIQNLQDLRDAVQTNMDRIIEIKQGAVDDGRDLTDDEIAEIERLVDANTINLGKIKDITKTAYAGEDGIIGTHDDLVDALGDEMTTINDLYGEHSNLETSFERLADAIQIAADKLAEAIKNLQEWETANRVAVEKTKGYWEKWRSGVMRIMGGLDTTEVPTELQPQLTPKMGFDPFGFGGDFIWRGGESRPFAFDPNDTVVAFKNVPPTITGGGGKGGIGNVEINIPVYIDTVASDIDIKSLTHDISIIVKEEIERLV